MWFCKTQHGLLCCIDMGLGETWVPSLQSTHDSSIGSQGVNLWCSYCNRFGRGPCNHVGGSHRPLGILKLKETPTDQGRNQRFKTQPHRLTQIILWFRYTIYQEITLFYVGTQTHHNPSPSQNSSGTIGGYRDVAHVERRSADCLNFTRDQAWREGG